LDRFPGLIEMVAWTFPLTYAAHVSRGLTLGELNVTMIYSTLALVGYTVVTLYLAVRLMRRRLIR
jgi:ABC-type multidrug transport system permease subunit